MTLTELSIKRPSLVIVVFSALILLGLFTYRQLQYELLPKISPPIITIITIYPGAAPSEVETGVSKVIEDAVSGMDKIDEVRSTSQEGLSFIFVQLIQSANVDLALQDAQRKVNEVITKLPAGTKNPTISKFAFDEIPVLRMGASSNLPPKEFYQFVKDQVKPRIAKLPGIGQIVLVGGEEREVQISLDAEKLRSYNMSILQVTQVIKASNLDFPTGKIKDKDGQFVVRVSGKFNSINELRDLSIGKSRQGGEIRLSDVAEVNDGIKDYATINRINGFTSIGVNIQKQSDANAVEVAERIKVELKKLEKDYAKSNLKFNIAQDASLFTIDAANAVKEDLAVAVIMVALVMLMFLHSIRNSIIVMVAIPSSLISTFIAIYSFGFTLNMMTLLGLSLVVGILVDDSIVVLENIYHHLEQGEKRADAALRGRNEIGFAALAITFVDVAVFLPLALVGGIVGNILKQFSMVVVISTLLSLLVSFTVTPMLASRFAKVERLSNRTLLGKFAIWFEQKFQNFTKLYLKILRWSFVNRKKVSLSVFAAFVFSIMLFPLGFIGGEFFAVADRGEFAITLELEPGSTFENTNIVSLKAEKLINSMPEVEKTFSNIGTSSEGLLGFSSNNNTEINVTLVPRGQRKRSTDEMMAALKKEVSKLPGVKVRANPIGIFGVANQTPIQILIKGPDPLTVNQTAKEFEKITKTIQGSADVRLSSEDGKPETKIEIDRDKLNSYGLTILEVGSTLNVALAGDEDSKFRDGNDEYVIRIRLDENNRNRTKDLGSLAFMNKLGQQIELKQFAKIVRSTGPTKLQRQDRISAVTLYSQVVGRPVGSLSQDITKEFNKIQLPAGVTWSFSGDVKNQNESFASMGFAFMAAIIFTYMIMVALYDSFIDPFVVLFSVPLAIIGAFLALALSIKSLSIFSILGIIMLIGLVAKNAILIVDRTKVKRAEGESVIDALIDAGKMRIRPIFMTTLTMIFGMAPIALSTSSGAEWKSGLAWALIGGLTSSLLLTLIIVPMVYLTVEELRISIPRFFRKIFRITKVDIIEN